MRHTHALRILLALFGPLTLGLSDSLSVNFGKSVGPLLTIVTLRQDISVPTIHPLTDFRFLHPLRFGVYCPVRPSSNNLVR